MIKDFTSISEEYQILPTRKWRSIIENGYPSESGRYWVYSPNTGVSWGFFFKP